MNKEVIEKLESVMISNISLSLSTKHVHWVIHGPNFISIHRYLDEVHADLVENADTLAEWLVSEFDYRIFSGEAHHVTNSSKISEVGVRTDMTPTQGAGAIASRLDVLVGQYGHSIQQTENYPATQDILIAQKQKLVEHRWFLESEVV